MQLRILFVIALVIGVAVSFALNKLQRSRVEHMMLGVVCVLTGGFLSLNSVIAGTTEASVVTIGLIYLGFVLGILGFFKR